MTRALPLPKYHRIYLVLREQIQEGQFDNGLPSEMALSERFDAGRVTVRRALELLAGDGLIIREPGRGTRPAPMDAAPSTGGRAGGQRSGARNDLLQNIVSMSWRTSIKVLEIRRMAAPQAVAEVLQIPVGAAVQKVVRRRSSHLGPVSHITTYMPEDRVAVFARKDLLRKPMLQLIEDSGVELGMSHQTISARQADDVVAAELDVAVGAALLWVHRVIYDSQQRPVQWLQGLYRPDRYQYRLERSRVGGVHARILV